MRLRYSGSCRVCGADLPARTEAVYEKATRTVRCLDHEGALGAPSLSGTEVVEPPAARTEVTPEMGIAGASARREFERRKSSREERIRSKHPRLGGLIVAMTDEPQSTTAWRTGATGEEVIGRRLDGLASDRLRLLHDRRIPNSRANIDHLAVTPRGIWVIDAKKYRGRPRLEIQGGIVRPRVERLVVGSRDCTRLVDGVLKQVDVVNSHLGQHVPVRGVLCFVHADWPLMGGHFSVRGVQALWPRKLQQELQRQGDLDVEAIAQIHRDLARALPAA